MYKIICNSVDLINEFPEGMTMIDAIKKSIAKWKFILDNHSELIDDGSGDTCALCTWSQRQLRTLGNSVCIVCPVAKKTGLYHCLETPYRKAVKSLSSRFAYYRIQSIRAEIEFLEEVLHDNEVQAVE